MISANNRKSSLRQPSTPHSNGPVTTFKKKHQIPSTPPKQPSLAMIVSSPSPVPSRPRVPITDCTPSVTLLAHHSKPTSNKQGTIHKEEFVPVTSGKHKKELHLIPKTPSPLPKFGAAPASSAPNNLELMLHHADFPRIVALGARVKASRTALVEFKNPDFIYTSFRPYQINNHSCSDALQVAARIKGQLAPNHQQTIPRGRCRYTDTLIDSSIMALKRELARVELCFRKSNFKAYQMIGTEQQPKIKKASGKGSGGIAVKHAKWQTDILMKWVVDHMENPFPTPADIRELVEKTNLTQCQISNWTTNVRKRNRKATLAGKKPHHFMDFMFLAQDRDNKMKSKDASTSTILQSKATYPYYSRKRKPAVYMPKQLAFPSPSRSSSIQKKLPPASLFPHQHCTSVASSASFMKTNKGSFQFKPKSSALAVVKRDGGKAKAAQPQGRHRAPAKVLEPATAPATATAKPRFSFIDQGTESVEFSLASMIQKKPKSMSITSDTSGILAGGRDSWLGSMGNIPGVRRFSDAIADFLQLDNDMTVDWIPAENASDYLAAKDGILSLRDSANHADKSNHVEGDNHLDSIESV